MSLEQLSTEKTAELARTIEALLFLSNHPVTEIELADACQVELEEIQAAVRILEAEFEPGRRGLVLRRVGEGLILATDPVTEVAARRLLAAPRTPPLTQAQAETLSIVAYLQPVARPEIARIRGVSSESAVTSLSERGLIEESGRSRFGATIYRTSALFEKVFGLEGVDALPDPTKFDPTPEDEREIRERLLAAGEQRADQ
ncbi:MAG: SMC-Scp complex subunit ScpB [Thermoleophilia bacterium]|nr:SMC-Scp complex subunit ScpB [Thermoleophilia bacterium]